MPQAPYDGQQWLDAGTGAVAQRVQAVGTRHHKFFSGSNTQTHTFQVQLFGIAIINEGTANITLTINDESTVLKPGQGYEGIMDTAFTSFTVTGSSAYKGEVLR